MNELIAVASSLAYGFGSAFVPVLNAEAYVGVAAAGFPVLLTLVVVAVSVGQTVGKMLLFEGARRGRRLVARRERVREPRTGPIATRLRRWNARLLRLLEDRRHGAATVLTSASVGLPPLAAVSVIAGTSSQRRSVFVLCCLAGRTVRFAVLAAPIGYAMS